MPELTSAQGLATRAAVLLLGAALVGMLARRIGVPYAVALVLGGLLLESTHVTSVPHLEPGLVLFGFLPPLLFDAAFRLDTREARILLRPIMVLALPGTLLTAVFVAGCLTLILGLPFGVALVFGSVVAATDPVAVVGVFKNLHAPARIAAIAESESLINDGVAITIYTAVLGLALGADVSLLQVMTIFGREVLGGALIGVIFGVVFSRLTAIVDDHLINLISAALAYGGYVAAQWVEASGPLACVAAGLLHGSYGRRIGMSETTSRLLDDLWEFLGFLAIAVVFLLVGFTVNLASLVANAGRRWSPSSRCWSRGWCCSVDRGLLLNERQLVTSGVERIVRSGVACVPGSRPPRPERRAWVIRQVVAYYGRAELK